MMTFAFQIRSALLARGLRCPRRMAATALFLALTLTGLAACAPVGVAVGAGAAVGIGAYQERGLEGAARDLRLEAAIIDAWMQSDHTLVTQVSAEVYDSRALLTGSVANEDARGLAVRLAWKSGGLAEVINEIQVNPDSGAIDFARDSWITTQLKTRITFDKNINAINYAIETVNGTIYLIGIAQNKGELDRVIAYANDISYVKGVVSHVRVKGAVK